MAVVVPVLTQVQSLYGHVTSVVWTLANGDTGGPVQLQGSADRSVQLSGTFGAGGSVTMQGSNDVAMSGTPTNWATLHDTANAVATYTTAAIDQLNEVSNWIRPNCTAGDGTTAIVVSMIFRGTL